MSKYQTIQEMIIPTLQCKMKNEDDIAKIRDILDLPRSLSAFVREP